MIAQFACRRFAITALLLASCVKGSAQTNTFTVTNLEGKVFKDVVLVKIEKDGVLFRLPAGAGWDRVKFTNMDKATQLQFGYDPEKARQEEEKQAAERLARDKADRDARIAAAKASQYHAIEANKYLLDPISKSDFPETSKAEGACKEIAAELKSMETAVQVGLSYNKFSDLITEKVMAIEKIKDLRGDGVPAGFLVRVSGCIDSYNDSRHWWAKKIDDSDSPGLEALDEVYMQQYWSTASLELIYIAGIAGKNTNANNLAIDQFALLIQFEQSEVQRGVVPTGHNLDPDLQGLNMQEIAQRVRQTLYPTNTPQATTSTDIAIKK